jgi:hypothetical protein
MSLKRRAIGQRPGFPKRSEDLPTENFPAKSKTSGKMAALVVLWTSQWIVQASRCVPRRSLGGSGGSGFQPAMARAHSRACMVSVINGNSRRSSTAAANSPLCSKAVRMAAASTSETTNMPGAWRTRTAAGKRRMGAALRPADSFHKRRLLEAIQYLLARLERGRAVDPASTSPAGPIACQAAAVTAALCQGAATGD